MRWHGNSNGDHRNQTNAEPQQMTEQSFVHSQMMIMKNELKNGPEIGAFTEKLLKHKFFISGIFGNCHQVCFEKEQEEEEEHQQQLFGF